MNLDVSIFLFDIRFTQFIISNVDLEQITFLLRITTALGYVVTNQENSFM